MTEIYVARRPIGMGPHQFAPGETITAEALDCLPARRLEQLVRQGWVEKVPG